MSFASPPGTLMAFGGPPSAANLALLAAAGWLYCDGSSYARADYPLLFAVMGDNYGGGSLNFSVPDLRGRFLRGTDHGTGRDPDSAQRTPSGTGGDDGDAVGSAQGWATGLPVNPFITDTAADHTHGLQNQPTTDGQTAAGASGPLSAEVMAWTDNGSATDQEPDHTHTINTGGDAESRPDNLYLFWYVKALAV
jgi:microcystin-dependent protein